LATSAAVYNTSPTGGAAAPDMALPKGATPTRLAIARRDNWLSSCSRAISVHPRTADIGNGAPALFEHMPVIVFGDQLGQPLVEPGQLLLQGGLPPFDGLAQCPIAQVFELVAAIGNPGADLAPVCQVLDQRVEITAELCQHP
jgi:hypothetical protein